jgi:hypothetical protein
MTQVAWLTRRAVDELISMAGSLVRVSVGRRASGLLSTVGIRGDLVIVLSQETG